MTRYARLRARKLCGRCQKRPAEKSVCSTCSAAITAATLARRARRHAAKQCETCEAPIESGHQCDACKEYILDQLSERRRTKRLELGLPVRRSPRTWRGRPTAAAQREAA